jgi:hypothetical protein
MWIKKSILCNGEDLGIGDLITFHNNITIAGNSASDLPVKIFNGEFATVEHISDHIMSKYFTIKKDVVELKYREMTIKLHSNGKHETVQSLENFRLNPKAEISENEKIALMIHQNQLFQEEIMRYPFEESDKYKKLQH